MSTSCIIALKSKEDGVLLLEKTHDGFFDIVKGLIREAKTNHCGDIEDFANYLIKNTDIRFSIYSHKYPCEMFVYDIDTDFISNIQIDPNINKINECMKYFEVANG